MRLSEILKQSATTAARPASPAWQVDDDPWGRRLSVPPSAPPDRLSPAAMPAVERKKPAAMPLAPATGNPASLVLPAPLRRLPPAWGLEIQRIAHHLAFGMPHAPQAVLFAAPIPASGVSTLTFLLSHHLASSAPEGRTLLLRYLPHPLGESGSSLPVGAPFSWQQLPANHILNTLTMVGGSDYSVAEKVRWFRALITSARQLFATILIDVPPFNRCAESYLLASESDGVVFVLKSGEVRKPALAALRSELQHMGINVLGSVLTFRRYPLPRWLIHLL